MRVIEVKDYREMSERAAAHILDYVNGMKSCTLGLATGGTPIGTYRSLVEAYRNKKVSFNHVYTVNLDEYVGLSAAHPNSYRFYMQENLFNHIDIPAEHTHIPNGMAADLAEECRRYEELIERLGGVDLQLLGIGINGHIGFNEPGTSFSSRTHLVKLTESTRSANARFFSNPEEVPTHAITMGIETIMRSREILLLAGGIKKAEILYKLFTEPVDEQIPASILQTHPNVTIIADSEALSRVKEKKVFIV